MDCTEEATVSVEEILSRAESTFAKFKQGDGEDHLSEAVNLDRQALDRCPPGHHMRWRSLILLGIHLRNRYNRLGAIEDTEEATVRSREALELCPEGHPDRSTSLGNVTAHLFDRYKRLGDMTDLNEAIVLGRQAHVLLPSWHPHRSLSSSYLAAYLSSRYDQLGDLTDLNEAIVLARQAHYLLPSGHPNLSSSLNNVGLLLSSRYNRLGDVTDLNEAIVLARQALDLCPPRHPDRSTSLNNVALHLSSRYNRLGDVTDLNEAIVLVKQALDLLPLGHVLRSMPLNNIAANLSFRYDRLGDVADLDEAIVFARQALNLRPSGHPHRPMSLKTLAGNLCSRYDQLGDVTDLNEAIVLGRQALDLLPSGHPDRSMSLSDIARSLSSRYKHLGDMTDLNEAIVLGRQALDLLPSGHPHRPSSLNNVALYLSSRYDRLGDVTDLNVAIILGRQALDLHSSGHPHHFLSLNNVAIKLSSRHTRLRDVTDINEAIVFGRQALDLCPSGHPHRPLLLNNVAVYLSSRYDQLEDVMDLNEAIVLGREALDLFPSENPHRSMSLNNLAGCLSVRYQQLGEVMDLNEAIVLGRQALDLRPLGHPERSSLLYRLTDCLRVRFTLSGELQDKEDLLNLYTELSSISQTVSPIDLPAAKEWITVAEDFCHPSILLAYETSLRILIQHLAMVPSLPNHLQTFKDLASSLAMDAFSACLRNHSTHKAVELLEQGRGVFWNQIARLRSPLEDIIASGQEGKALAHKFTRLSSEIRNTIHSPQALDQYNTLCSLNVDLQSVITQIRKLPGLDRFLLPSSFSELRHAASGGPVIILNASKYTCDALVLFFDRDPVHIPLPITKSRVQELSSDLRSLTFEAKIMDVDKGFIRFLRILWDEVVSPIACFLQTTVSLYSHIWWCPTAEFSLLPLHAASPYRKGQRGIPQLYISSYTPTLTALIHARRNDPSATTLRKKRFLTVGQGNAEGESELPSVGSELAVVAEAIKGHATFTTLDGPESTLSQVSKELTKSEWVHFACHGIPDMKQPFNSAFALHDGRFTVERIMGCELENAKFAYLSACHTTVGDEESPDEVIHLASAMQFAGFRSVIGTMWAVDDELTNEIASKFYKNMLDGRGQLDHTRSALALHRTMNSLAGSILLDQRILYVHIGA